MKKAYIRKLAGMTLAAAVGMSMANVSGFAETAMAEEAVTESTTEAEKNYIEKYGACDVLSDAQLPITAKPDENGNYRYFGEVNISGLEFVTDEAADGKFTIHVRNGSSYRCTMGYPLSLEVDMYYCDYYMKRAIEEGKKNGKGDDYGSLNNPATGTGVGMIGKTYEETTLEPGQECVLTVAMNKDRAGKKQIVRIDNVYLYDVESDEMVSSFSDIYLEERCIDIDQEEERASTIYYKKCEEDNLQFAARNITDETWNVMYMNTGDRIRIGDAEKMTWTLTTDVGEYTCTLPSVIVTGYTMGAISMTFDGAEGTPISLRTNEIDLMENETESRGADEEGISTSAFTIADFDAYNNTEDSSKEYELVEAEEFVQSDPDSDKVTDEMRDLFAEMNNAEVTEDLQIDRPVYEKSFSGVGATGRVNNKAFELIYLTPTEDEEQVALFMISSLDNADIRAIAKAVMHAYGFDFTDDEVDLRIEATNQSGENGCWLDEGKNIYGMISNGMYIFGHIKDGE